MPQLWELNGLFLMQEREETAVAIAERIRRRGQSAVEVTKEHLTTIEALNPQVNAIVTLTADRALGDAVMADSRLAKGDVVGPLHGLPIAHKDLVATEGIRTTM